MLNKFFGLLFLVMSLSLIAEEKGNDRLCFSVEGMTCMSCVGKIRRELNAKEGTQVEKLSLDGGLVVATGLSSDEVLATITNAGYQAKSTSCL